MSRDPSTDLFRTQLFGGTDFELAGSDRATGTGYRVTVRHGDIDVAPFSLIDEAELRSCVEAGLPLTVGATHYRIECTFGPKFLPAVRAAARVTATSVTVQSPRKVTAFIGNGPLPLADAVDAYLPATLEWLPGTLVEGSREWGRKIGRAAKDRASLREATFGPDDLAAVERSGDSEAYEAVSKKAVWPAPTLDALRARGLSPAVAFGTVSCWRMLPQRPARNPAARLSFVVSVPTLRAALERCRTLDDFTRAVASAAKDLGGVGGTRLPRFAQRLHSQSRAASACTDSTLRTLLALGLARDSDSDDSWAVARRALSKRTNRIDGQRSAGLPLPARIPLPLNRIVRTGPDLPEPPSRERVREELGITGLELGNTVSGRDGERLIDLLSAAWTDLRCLVGDWIVPLCRRGNLSIALGARGKGRFAAHYEPALRVINMTKAHGDGSLAHEFAHFLDHMLAGHAPVGESRFLSARVKHLGSADHPIASAAARVMRTVAVALRRERVVGEIAPRRWFLRPWIARRGYDPALAPQVSFDRVADLEPATFRHGRDPRGKSVSLVHSLAKFSDSQVEVEIAFEGESDFARQAKQLGVYWSRPEELFARAFEAFVEDEAARRGWCSPYLVSGTRLGYTGRRGLPYPTGGERERIAEALRDLLAACATEGLLISVPKE